VKTALITGVNGFVGSHLAGDFARRGWRVVGTTSNTAGLETKIPGTDRKWILHLAAQVTGEIFDGVDAVVHCAYELRPQKMEQNVSGTQRIAEAAAEAGVTHQLFISSTSAHAAAASGYGKTKFKLQEYFLARGHAVVRPGLIIGPGGMFQRLVRTLKLPVVPLPDGGRDKVSVVGVVDFQTALATVIDARRSGLFNLFNPDPATLRELFASIRAASGSRALLLPFPSVLLRTMARSVEKIGLPLPFDAASFAALKANQCVGERSDLGEFVPKPLTLAEMVEAASRTAPHSAAR